MTSANNIRRGLGFLVAGFALLLRRPKLAALGMLPPLIVSVFAVVGLLLLGIFGLSPLTDALTTWAGGSLRTVARIVIGFLIMAVAVVVVVVLFVTVTLAVGGPIYDRISQNVEQDLGEQVLTVSEPALRGMWRGLRQSIATVGLSIGGALIVFLLGLIPVVGPVLALVTGAIVGGFLLTTELISGPFDRWGRTGFREKLGTLNRNRLATLGFGIPVFMLFSIPILSVVFFPAATAGATLLAMDLRPGGTRVIGEPLVRD